MNKMKNMKRVLAFVLSICLVAVCWTAGPLHAASTLYTSDEVENATYSLNGKKYTICYEDDFENEADYNAALGSYATHAHKIPWSQGGIAPDGATKNALFYGIKDAENMQNYSISADVKMNTEAGNATALVVYGAKTSNANNGAKGYEFGITNIDGTPSFRLHQRGGVNDTVVGKAGTTTYPISTTLNGTYTKGTVITMRMDVRTEENQVVIKCYAAFKGEKLDEIFTYSDSADTRFTAGVPGFRSNDKSGGLISNVCITSVEDDDTCLYSDNFSIEEGYTEALGTENITYNMALSSDDYLYNSVSGNKNSFSVFSGIEEANSLTNYTVSADIVWLDTTKSYYNGVLAYGTANGTTNTYGYEFAIIGSTSGPYFRLCRRTASGATILDGNNTDDLVNGKGKFLEYSAGDLIRLSMTAISNSDGSTQVICKAIYKNTEKEIFNVPDRSNNITLGIPGVRGNQTNSTVDNVLVQTNAQYLASLSTAYGDTLALGNAIAPYDIPKVDKMLAAYDGLEMLLDADTIAALAEIETFRANWDTTSDETIAASFETIYSSGKWDAATAWNVYQRLTASQKALLSDVYEALVTAMKNETQSGDTNLSIGWVGETVPSELVDALANKYSVEAYDEANNYDIIVLAKGVNEEELHSYLRLENSPLVVMTTTAASEEEGTANLKLAEQYGLAWVDSAAYVNGGGTEREIYVDTISSLELLFATASVKGFAYDINVINSFLNPVLFSATIKNEPLPANQGLGFKTNLSKYQKTGASIESYGTIFARYNSTQSYDDMLLENVDNGKYFNANIDVTDDSKLYGDSFIAGINLETNAEFSRVYIARSYVKYSDGSVYYSMNSREDLSSSLATKTGVVDGQATRALTGVAKNMVSTLAKNGTDVSSIASYDATTGKVTFLSNATSNNAKAIFELICSHQSTLDTIQRTVFVSSEGDDSSKGTIDAPFATFDKALAEVPNGGVIWVKDTVTVASDFEWKERDYAITVTGDGALNFAIENDAEGNAVYRQLVLGDDVTFDAVGLTFRKGSSQWFTDVLYANGHKLVIDDDVRMNGVINLYGGGNRTNVESTDITLKTGNYIRVFGGCYGGTVNGNTSVCIGGDVNANAIATSHEHGYDIYGGGDAACKTSITEAAPAYVSASTLKSAVSGCTNITFEGNAKANYVLGGCRSTGSVGTTNIVIHDGQIFSLFGGNDSAKSIKGTNVLVKGGTIEQIFGGNQSASCIHPSTNEQVQVVVKLEGGKITRRVYGGCYNQYTPGFLTEGSWNTERYVEGTIDLYISDVVEFSFDSDTTDDYGYDDYSIYARSRYGTAHADETCTLTFTSQNAYDKHMAKLGTTQSDDYMAEAMSNVTPYDGELIIEQ